MNPAYIQQLVGIADAVAAAGHGEKETIYQRACEQLGKSRGTLLKHLKKVAVGKPRKRRADAGVVALSLDDARTLSAYCMEGYRKNNKKITALKEAIQVLRDNGEIVAATLDAGTGELVPLSESAIANGLRTYNLHPDQLRQATPHTNLQSLHPNHVWQVDGSVCVIYYLPDGGSELVELDDAVHYKNKPQNLKAIEQFRVIRYVVSDHASGVVRYRYYPHSESGQHTVRFLAWAIAPKGGNDPFHGRPDILMVDPGATSGGLVQRFCTRIGTKLIINRRRNPRAKGSVEKGNHLVETSFEQALRYMKKRPANFDELNALAETYQLWWNATKEHTRTKRTRFAVWLTITAEQLRITPSAEVLLSLATEEPVKRQVRGDLTIEFKKRIWKVDHVSGVYVKSDVYVHWHPFMVDTAMAVIWGEDGQEQHIALYEDKINALGFRESAAVIGEEHKAKADTVADTNRKQVHQLAAGTDTLAATEKKRDNKHYVPFDGRIDPLLASKQELPTFMPKRGTELDVKAPTVELLRMNAVQAGKWLLGRLGSDYRPELMADVRARFPDGATEEDLEQVLADLAAGRSAIGKAQLRAI
jgi:hypothetical protein